MDREKLHERNVKYAEKAGYKLNPNKIVVDKIEEGLLKNEKKHGEIYCPCRVVSGDKEKDKLIICPCVYHKDEIKEMGHCHCFLFVDKNK
jgi:ferredoxin-thioredoxin reductase catalytic chain